MGLSSGHLGAQKGRLGAPLGLLGSPLGKTLGRSCGLLGGLGRPEDRRTEHSPNRAKNDRPS
eukprot:1150685-Pyramimonas_sp.AAC.1